MKLESSLVHCKIQMPLCWLHISTSHGCESQLVSMEPELQRSLPTEGSVLFCRLHMPSLTHQRLCLFHS